MPERTLTLLGPDVLLVAMGEGRPNNAVLAIECAGALDVARVERAVARLQPLAPFMSSRLERPRPWGRLRWRAIDAAPPVSARRQPIDAAVDELLNETVDPRRDPPLRWRVIEAADAVGGALLLAWVHPLMDPRGAELLVAMLDAVDRGGDDAAWAAARPIVPPPDGLDWRAQSRLARRALPGLRALSREPPYALTANGRGTGPVRHARRTVRSAARQSPATLASVARAMTALWHARGVPLDRPFVVPVSVDRRRKGEPGPVFGNFVSFHFARVAPGDDAAALAAAVRRDMAEAVRTDAVEALWAGMSFVRIYPPRHLLRPLGGRALASFHCADTGDVRPRLATLFGLPVHAAYHAPCVQPHPGIGVFFSRSRDVESVVAVWVDGVVTASEVDRVLDAIAADVGAAPVA